MLRHNSHLLALTLGGGDGTGGAAMREGDETLLGAISDQDLLGLGTQGMHLGLAGGDMARHFGVAGEEGLGFSERSPGSSTVQMTGWGQFDSLVSLLLVPLESSY